MYRRLEARGEIRSGRFVTGMSGEQFALPHAVEELRHVRRLAADGLLVTISAADPLNLAGIVTAGERIRTAGRNRIVYRDGVPIAVVEGGVLRELAPMDAETAAEVSRTLRARLTIDVRGGCHSYRRQARSVSEMTASTASHHASNSSLVGGSS